MEIKDEEDDEGEDERTEKELAWRARLLLLQECPDGRLWVSLLHDAFAHKDGAAASCRARSRPGAQSKLVRLGREGSVRVKQARAAKNATRACITGR